MKPISFLPPYGAREYKEEQSSSALAVEFFAQASRQEGRSFSNDQEVYDPFPHDFSFYLIFLVQCVTLLVGFVGNGILVLMFSRHRALRTPTNTYILGIASADLLVTFSCPGVFILTDLAGTWPLGITACKFTQATMEFSVCASVLTLTALSMERYYAVMYPIERFMSSQKFTVLGNVIIWIVAILFSVPKYLNSGIVMNRVNGTNGFTYVSYCVLLDDKNIFNRYFSLFDVFAFYVIPFCIICFLYATIYFRLKTGTENTSGNSSSKPGHQALMRNKVARMVLVLTGIFFISFFPYNVLRLRVYIYGGEESYWKTAASYAYCFSCMHYWLNPIALYLFCDTFRKHYRSYFLCHCLRWTRSLTSSKVQSDDPGTILTTTSASDRFSQITGKPHNFESELS